MDVAPSPDCARRSPMPEAPAAHVDYDRLLARTTAAMLEAGTQDALFARVCAVCVADGGLREAHVCLPDAVEGPAVARALASGESVVVPATDGVGDAAATAYVPVPRGGAVAGALRLVTHGNGPPFDARALRVFGAVASNLGLALDEIEREAQCRQAIDEAQRGLDRFQKIFDATPVATVIATLDEGRLMAVNDAYCALMRLPREALLQRTTVELGAWIDPAERERLVRRLRRSRVVRDDEVRLRVAGGEVRDVLLSSDLIEFGGQACMLSILNDITQRKRYEREIRFLATHDGLTQLPNRTLLTDRTEQALQHARRSDSKVAVLFLDVDRFKTVNETLGHAGGDRVLVELASRMRRAVREGDTVARMSGDEFAILVPDVVNLGDCYNLVQRLLVDLAAPLEVNGHSLKLAVSIGGSVFPGDGDDAEALLHHAEAAMVGAKRTRPGTAQFATPQMSAELRRLAQLESQLNVALAAGQLRLVYQPRIEVQTGRIAGTEALMRWVHPELGEVPPSAFIPVAEEAGAVIPIGAWALHNACQQNMAWQAAGLPALPVSVNVSARQFLQPDLVATVAAALEATGMPGHLLEIEITETVFARNAEHVVDIMSLLRELGVRFSIDDFGTGYSNLGYLKRFRLDGLKIDQSFVRNLDRDPGDAAIALAVIAMARTLDLEVIAEGVENAAQYAFLKRNHCDEVQGFYFSAPVDADALARMVREGRGLH
jgi:diguanylate cyclase (GGDEF)-like protein/PAS domain S-box-containing protein